MVQELHKGSRIFPAGNISAQHVDFVILITFMMRRTIGVGYVSACQLCLRNMVDTSNTIPVSFRRMMPLESFPTEIEHSFESSRIMLSNVEYSRKRSSFIPRRQHPQLFMMLSSDSKNQTSVIETVDTVNVEINQTNFDATKFFDELQRSGENRTINIDSQQEDVVSLVMLGAIGFYKKVISPVLPRACRFVPTCSSYGVQAIQEFGPTKGIILITWRILRCTPIGGKGYDPPKWPPVFYTYSSY